MNQSYIHEFDHHWNRLCRAGHRHLFCRSRAQVICVDKDAEKVKLLHARRDADLRAGPGGIGGKNVKAGRLRFTTSTQEGVEQSDVIFIAVPTPPMPDGSVDLSFIEGGFAGDRRGDDGLQNHR